ncbi:SET domain-containing protein 4 [Amphibalanus amphitrite]|uniref:SET domain-containing protein 4 n=1 Tax=Amphibalanus amphitrite TaxID=1232801 RepID=A0A6A4W7M9_AMPAM|nr:SET domain-containing protein 4 [Amphibalanus amphitrite]
MGRTKRVRRRKRAVSADSSVDVDGRLAELVGWMRRHRWSGPGPLRPALFPDTGRGLLSRRPLQPGATLVSIPLSLLVSSATALRSELGAALRAARPAVSAQLAVSLWLALERRRGADSGWRPYLASLPSAYTTPAYCEPRELSADLLPEALLSAARLQHAAVRRNLLRARRLLRETSAPCVAGWELSEEELRHAWVTVKTRAMCVEPEEDLGNAPSGLKDDNCALAPFLDLFNHRPGATVYSSVSDGCYRLMTEHGVAAGEQVFIDYGPRDNLQLVLDYGFVVPGNERDAVPVPAEWVPLPAEAQRAADDARLRSFLSVGREGYSRDLLTRLYLAALPEQELASVDGQEVQCMSLQELTAPAAVRRTLAALLVRLVRHLESCLAAQRAMPAPSDALRVCSALLREWLLVLQGHVWERGRRPGADGVVRPVYGTRLGDVVTESVIHGAGGELTVEMCADG